MDKKQENHKILSRRRKGDSEKLQKQSTSRNKCALIACPTGEESCVPWDSFSSKKRKAKPILNRRTVSPKFRAGNRAKRVRIAGVSIRTTVHAREDTSWPK